MEEQELLWSASGQELMRGVALLDGQYRCLLCGAAFPQGDVLALTPPGFAPPGGYFQ